MIKDEIDTRKIETGKAIDQEINGRIEAAAAGDKATYKKTVDELKREKIERKAKADEELNREQEARCLSLKEKVMAKWTSAASNESELEAILQG